ncbi:hypothetical protein HUZ99_05205 [Staphylococcus sp. SS87]|nr:hypothetical protein [Staphylococcus singaporensis]MBE5675815.1 hypothetical protein [Staphylococcus singaporensis]
MRVSAENPAFGTPLIGFPEHKIFMSHPLILFSKQKSNMQKIKNASTSSI